MDSSKQFQEILGFGGAFTEASAENWMKMSAEDKDKIVHLYFADPSEGGHGYTIGRVPMGSCDFASESYSFNNFSGDDNLNFFDKNVTQDEVNGMLPLMRAAQDLVTKRGQQLKIFASPWSPPPWMKIPVNGKHSFDGSATPVGLSKPHMRSWAKYFSAFIDAYKTKGIELWGVTPQNEPEFAAPWEACVYTPEYESEFVREHLGPVLRADHPGVKIIGFDHNKDHVVDWAKVLYGDSQTKDFIDGIGVHWYGGLNTQHLDETHNIAPDKFILATEACNCPSVVYQDEAKTWWSRAEKLAIDILEDLKWWSVGWTDWNLMVNTIGGPNHVGNNCDANIVCDPGNTKGFGTVVVQASYYFMGHFSRFVPRGSRRVSITSTVKVQDKLTPSDVDGKMLQFVPCDANTPAQTWKYNEQNKTLTVAGLTNMCAEFNAKDGEAIQMKPCVQGSSAQTWTMESDGTSKVFVNGKDSSLCLSKLQTGGARIGLDPGVDANAGFAEACKKSLTGSPRDQEVQSFTLTGSVPDAFQITTSKGDCMLPVGTGNVIFDAVAFQTPSGNITVVAMNLKDDPVNFDIYDTAAKGGYRAVELPAHSIATYTWPASSYESEEVIAYI